MDDVFYCPESLSPRTLGSLVLRNAEQFPLSPAIEGLSRVPLTYTGLQGHASRIGADLRRSGIERRDCVAVVLPNSPEMASAFIGIAAAATCAPLNPAYREAEVGFFLRDLKAKAIVLPEERGELGDDPAARAARKLGLTLLRLRPDREAAGLFTLFSDSAPEISDIDALYALDSAQPSDVALMLHTSGTTGRPKLVPITHENLMASVDRSRRALKITSKDRCLNVMPLFHIHGLVGATLLSLCAGGSVFCSPGFDATQFYDWLDAARPTWYTAVPSMHQSILARAADHPDSVMRNPLRLIRSGSAPLAPQTMAGLEKAFSAPVIEVYGMTEASHQITCNPLPPGTRKPGSVGLTGDNIAVMDSEGTLLSTGMVGEVVIRGAAIMTGYLDNPEANAKAFKDGWFRTGDQGTIDGDGYLFLTGRIKEIINRGGEKIAPREIDEALLRHPAVAQAVAFSMPDARLGEEVAAAVVLRGGASVDEQTLREFTSAHLADFKVPKRVLFLAEIPKGPTGKVQRVALAETLGLIRDPLMDDVARSEYVAPRTEVEIRLAEIWSEVLKRESIGIHDRFLQLGGDSILAARVTARVNAALSVNLSLIVLFQAETIEEMAGQIAAHRALRSGTVPDQVLDQYLAEIELMNDDEAEQFLESERR